MNDQSPTAGSTATADRCGEVRATPQSLRRGKHGYLDIPTGLNAGSGRQRAAALGTARRKDGATGTGAHAQPETVGLGTAAVVRLIGALAHVRTPSSTSSGGIRCKTPLYQSAAEQPLNPTHGGCSGQPYPGSARRHAGTPRSATWPFRTRSESFTADERGMARTAVVVPRQPLLACAVAGLTRPFADRGATAKTGQAGGSFATVSLFQTRATTGSGDSAAHPAGSAIGIATGCG
jgi:hypothetical protein